ncbi:hypothetical protein LEMLEM_LOCUS21673 [Lemmus lemmus]
MPGCYCLVLTLLMALDHWVREVYTTPFTANSLLSILFLLWLTSCCSPLASQKWLTHHDMSCSHVRRGNFY